eukprot:TRINITY_DN8907_c0_g1_i2.p1 TRINITY_DN8907_c0_g1~~TRINITY_DN8907_c0_g1_i2.p1  ORF type:complete len:580 (-),score=125.65 TRINITY_DN8907_c0_g1_i2:227-1966(-)
MAMVWERVMLNMKAKEVLEGKKSPGRKGGIMGPGRRWGHTCNSVKNGRFLYVFGGYGKDNCQTNDVHVYDSAKGTWSKPMVKGKPPSPRDSHSCTTVGTDLFVFGGTDGKNPLSDLHILDTTTNVWTQPRVTGEGPTAREGHSATLVGRNLYIFGGCGKAEDEDEIYYNDLYILDTAAYQWAKGHTKGTPPIPRDSHTCSTWDNKIVIVGGEDASDSYLCDVHILDPETGLWTKAEVSGDVPSPRFSVAGDCLDARSGTLVFIGGCNEHLEALDDMYFLHTGMAIENGQDEQRTEKFSLRRELKRRRLEHQASLNDSEKERELHKSDVSLRHSLPANQTNPGPSGANAAPNNSLYEFRPAEERFFEATITDVFHYGYTLVTTIDGKPMRGLIFSNKPGFAHSVHAYLKRKRQASEASNVPSIDVQKQSARRMKQAVKRAHVVQNTSTMNVDSVAQLPDSVQLASPGNPPTLNVESSIQIPEAHQHFPPRNTSAAPSDNYQQSLSQTESQAMTTHDTNYAPTSGFPSTNPASGPVSSMASNQGGIYAIQTLPQPSTQANQVSPQRNEHLSKPHQQSGSEK